MKINRKKLSRLIILMMVFGLNGNVKILNENMIKLLNAVSIV